MPIWVTIPRPPVVGSASSSVQACGPTTGTTALRVSAIEGSSKIDQQSSRSTTNLPTQNLTQPPMAEILYAPDAVSLRAEEPNINETNVGIRDQSSDQQLRDTPCPEEASQSKMPKRATHVAIRAKKSVSPTGSDPYLTESEDGEEGDGGEYVEYLRNKRKRRRSRIGKRVSMSRKAKSSRLGHYDTASSTAESSSDRLSPPSTSISPGSSDLSSEDFANISQAARQNGSTTRSSEINDAVPIIDQAGRPASGLEINLANMLPEIPQTNEDPAPRDRSVRSTSSLSAEELPHLGYDLHNFGVHGLKWMKEHQSRDPTFQDQQTVKDAEHRLGSSLQRLDRTDDCHFPTNLTRFGMDRASIEQRVQEGKADPSPQTSSKRGKRSRRADCGDWKPAFMYTHPSLICANNKGHPTLFARFSNANADELKLLSCHSCWTSNLRGCSFRNGYIRLRLWPDESIKIIYKPTGTSRSALGKVRNISQTNVGIENDGRSARRLQKLGTGIVRQRSVHIRGESSTRLQPGERGVSRSQAIEVGSSDDSDTDPENEEEDAFIPALRYQIAENTMDFNKSKSDQVPREWPASGSPVHSLDEHRQAYQAAGPSTAQTFRLAPSSALTIKSPDSGAPRHEHQVQVPSGPADTAQSSRPAASVKPAAILDLEKMVKDAEARNQTLKKLQKLKADNEAMELALLQ